MTDVLIVGGGVVGLLSALQLADAGLSVTLLDSGQMGQEASWAGGGIVSPLYPWRYGSAITALAHWSQLFYPQLGQRLMRESGLDPEVYVTGLYWLNLEDQAQALDWAQREQKLLVQVDLEKLYQKLPVLGSGFTSALYMADVANVRNPRLVKALRALLLRMPSVNAQEYCQVDGFVVEAGRVIGVRAAGGELRADKVVLCAGAWSGELLASLGLGLPVEPVRGQMILYKCAEDFLPGMVLAGGRYAIPRRDGHILVGSTLEYAGFDKRTTEEALESLKASAVELLPALQGVEVERHWAGLRPGSPGGVPFIGAVPGYSGLWLNCGHYRNGLVLAPASCRLLADLILGEEPIIPAAPYAPLGRLVPL